MWSVSKKENFIKIGIQQTLYFTQLAILFSIFSPSLVKKSSPTGYHVSYFEELLDFIIFFYLFHFT
jgi:hypothetical protein